MPATKSKKFTHKCKWPAQLEYSKLSQSPACSASSKNHQLWVTFYEIQDCETLELCTKYFKPNFANNFVSTKKFLKAFKENINSDNPNNRMIFSKVFN